MRRKLIAGNWKMNGLGPALAEIAALRAALPDPPCDVLVCPPATLLHRVAVALEGSYIGVGGQDCHAEAAGARTGDISAAMLADAGARAVILGHSERRTDHGETSALVAAKARTAMAAGLLPILCVGETEAERAAGAALDVVRMQLVLSLPAGLGETVDPARLVVAYEPVWAIGTGRVPGEAEIAEVHGALRAGLAARMGAAAAAGVRLLYGGSVKPANAAALLAVPDVDGALVGGASLRATEFAAIVTASVRP